MQACNDVPTHSLLYSMMQHKISLFLALKSMRFILSSTFINLSNLHNALHSFLGPHNSLLKRTDSKDFFRMHRGGSGPKENGEGWLLECPLPFGKVKVEGWLRVI